MTNRLRRPSHDARRGAVTPAPGDATPASPRTTGAPVRGRRIEWVKLGRELVGTFIGVLLALAANAAWASWQDSRREEAMLAALRDDVAAYRTDIAESIAHEDSAMHADTMLLGMLRNVRPIAPDSVARWTHPLNWSQAPATPGTTRGLTESGDATVLRDLMLRARVARFVALSESATESIAQSNAEHLARSAEMLLLLEPYATPTGPNGSKDRLVRALPRLGSSMEFRNGLNTVTAIRQNRLAALMVLQQAADSLALALEP